MHQIYVIVGIVGFIIPSILYSIPKVKSKLELKPDMYSVAVLIYIIGIMLFIKFDYERHGGIYSYLYTILFLLLFVLVLIIIKSLKTNHKLQQKQLELESREKYEEAYNKLLLEMRRKQHDYKNQIVALYSIQTLSDNQERLAEIQKDYADNLLKREKFDELLIGCDNPVLSGYVYTFCNEADRLGIMIKPYIMCANKEHNIALYEIIEILGILINNSIEYLKDSEFENKEIKIEVYDKNDNIHIVVSNVAEFRTYQELEKMFHIGYSTKGNDRGIGLYSLKHIVQTHNGQLLVENNQEEDVNWLKIEVIF